MNKKLFSSSLTVICLLAVLLCFATWIYAQQDQPEQEITNSIGMKLRLIPVGEFIMGAIPSGSDSFGVAFSDEGPRRRVEVTKPFYIGVFEVTQEQYEAVMGTNPSYFKGSRRPVEQVSWNDAKEFCRKLSQKEGMTYRLPTEAEWEYACRAGTTTSYYWGDSDSESTVKSYAWYENNADDSDWTEPHAAAKGTQEVGCKEPNAWGLYDMSGNVWEWCSDWYDENYYSRSPSRDPRGPSSGFSRVLRGGSWHDVARYLRSSARGSWSPEGTVSYNGFRVVREVE